MSADSIRRRAKKLSPILFRKDGMLDMGQAMMTVMMPLVTAVFFFFLLLPPSTTSDPLFDSFSPIWWLFLIGFLLCTMIFFFEFLAVKTAIETKR